MTNNHIELSGISGQLFKRSGDPEFAKTLADAVFVPDIFIIAGQFDYKQFLKAGWADFNARFYISGLPGGHGIPDITAPASEADAAQWLSLVRAALEDNPGILPA